MNKVVKVLILGAIVNVTSFVSAQTWNLSGNAITTGQFIGTTNNQPLVFKVNGVESFKLRTDNTIFYGVKVIYNDVIKFKIFKNLGAPDDRLVSVDRVGNLKLATSPVVENLEVLNTFTANGGIRFGDGSILTTASAGGGVFSLNGSNAFYNNGGVGIGTNTVPTGFRLAVRGKIIAEEISIKLHANWPDYVFGSSYKMRNLSELETYIQLNKHLPDVPSATEVEEKGVNLGEMDAILLRKIEELTLYTIEQQKMIERQAEALEGQGELIEKQGKLIESLTSNQ